MRSLLIASFNLRDDILQFFQAIQSNEIVQLLIVCAIHDCLYTFCLLYVTVVYSVKVIVNSARYDLRCPASSFLEGTTQLILHPKLVFSDKTYVERSTTGEE